jgi:hypothetical protein
MLDTPDEYMSGTEKEFEYFCDEYFTTDSDSEIIKYCKDKNIPIDDETTY